MRTKLPKDFPLFQPEKVAFEAGRIMLERIEYLLTSKENFAFETTLSTKSYKSKVKWAKENGYTIKLLFFWLPSVEMAIDRVKMRVKEGGHNIPKEIISRRYKRGLENLFKIYIPLCDDWIVFDNSEAISQIIAEGNSNTENNIQQPEKWLKIKSDFC